MGQILLIRHGQASFGAEDYDHLSELGFNQASLLGRWFNSCGLPLDRAITGAMRRHRETASGCMNAWNSGSLLRSGCPLTTDDRFNEFDHLDVIDVYRKVSRGAPTASEERAVHHSSLPFEQWKGIWSLAMERWISSENDGDYREAWPHFRKRCVDAFEAATDGTHPAKVVAVFTSGGPIAAICQNILNLSDSATVELVWSLANTGVTRLLFTKGRRGLGYLNSTAHFDWARAPNLLTYR